LFRTIGVPECFVQLKKLILKEANFIAIQPIGWIAAKNLVIRPKTEKRAIQPKGWIAKKIFTFFHNKLFRKNQQ